MRPCGTFDERYGQDMAIVRTRFQWVMLIVGIGLFLGVYGQVSGYFMLCIANTIGITIIAALGLQILLGYCGQISIGHMAFVAVGAYTTGMLTYHLGWPWIAAFPVAVVASALVGVAFGIPALRIKGFYLALSTMAAHFIIMWAILHGGEITGGAFGLPVPPPKFGAVVINSERAFFYLIMAFVLMMTFLAKNLVRTKLGRAFIAVRDNDVAAEFMGINIVSHKLLAFGIASGFAGAAGALYAPYLGNLAVEQFAFIESLWYIGYLIVGGMGSITGVYFGVTSLVTLKHLIMVGSSELAGIVPALSSGISAALMQIFFGTVIALFLIFEPLGLHHRWETAKSSIRLWPFPY